MLTWGLGANLTAFNGGRPEDRPRFDGMFPMVRQRRRVRTVGRVADGGMATASLTDVSPFA
jgi:hypothetical protein